MNHPHPDKRHVMTIYRHYILELKRKNGSARSLVHYRQFIAIYLQAKREVLQG
jgi:hypothetical protein